MGGSEVLAAQLSTPKLSPPPKSPRTSHLHTTFAWPLHSRAQMCIGCNILRRLHELLQRLSCLLMCSDVSGFGTISSYAPMHVQPWRCPTYYYCSCDLRVTPHPRLHVSVATRRSISPFITTCLLACLSVLRSCFSSSSCTIVEVTGSRRCLPPWKAMRPATNCPASRPSRCWPRCRQTPRPCARTGAPSARGLSSGEGGHFVGLCLGRVPPALPPLCVGSDPLRILWGSDSGRREEATGRAHAVGSTRPAPLCAALR